LTSGEFFYGIDVHRRIIIKYIFKEYGMIMGTELIWLDIIPWTSFVNTVLNLHVPQKKRSFFTGQQP
jgi:hypothetical protein